MNFRPEWRPVADDRDSSALLPPSASEVRRQLQRIVGSEEFDASERNRRFLGFVVERTLQRKAVSGYDVATEIFGRAKSFDGAKDPIVRIEAGKLRQALELYYLKSGKDDPVVIRLCKGRYRALFSSRQSATAGDFGNVAVREVLLAAMEGWAGDDGRAAESWLRLREKFPDIFFNPEIHRVLHLLHGGDERLGGLLLEGLRRSAGGRALVAAAPEPVASH